jgi:hypothetical protein
MGLLAVREFVVLALFGGGLAATPEGLRFTWGRRSMLFRWSDVTCVAVEGRTSGRRAYDVLVIQFCLGVPLAPGVLALVLEAGLSVHLATYPGGP